MYSFVFALNLGEKVISAVFHFTTIQFAIILNLSYSYVIDLTYYLLTKAEGKSWQGDPAVERLIEARTVSQIWL